jgi:uncharacterized protein YneF (UPF0154 family)
MQSLDKPPQLLKEQVDALTRIPDAPHLLAYAEVVSGLQTSFYQTALAIVGLQMGLCGGVVGGAWILLAQFPVPPPDAPYALLRWVPATLAVISLVLATIAGIYIVRAIKPRCEWWPPSPIEIAESIPAGSSVETQWIEQASVLYAAVHHLEVYNRGRVHSLSRSYWWLIASLIAVLLATAGTVLK